MQLAQQIYQCCHLTGKFKLRSGLESDEYFDKYRFESDPVLLKQIAIGMADAVMQAGPLSQVGAFAGLEMGGIPIATALSLQTGIPQVFVRKEAKEYGTAKLAEGIDIGGMNLVVVEDVITTGGQVIKSAIELRNRGANILGVVCVILRDEKAIEILQGAGLGLLPLYVWKEGRLMTWKEWGYEAIQTGRGSSAR
jgi:orotate phosphoribosyltransferase